MSTTVRCTECGKPIAAGSPTVAREGRAGTRMGLAHRVATNHWHPACWDEVERFAAQSRDEAEEQRLDGIRKMAASLGLTPEQVSEMARENGTPDPYGRTN